MKTNIFYIDAMRYDYINENTPFLDSLFKNKLKTIVGYSATIQRTIWTGCYPQKHRVFSGYYFNPQKKAKKNIFYHAPKIVKHFYKYYKMLSDVEYDFLPNAPAYVQKNFEREKPFEALPGKIRLTSFFDILKEKGISYSFKTIWDLKKRENTRDEVNIFYLPHPDKYGHSHGAGSKKVEKTMKDIDNFVKNNSRCDNLFVWADHGMANVTGHIDVEKVLRKNNLKIGVHYYSFYDKTMARFWSLKKGAEEKIVSQLKKCKQLECVNKKMQKKWGIKFSDNKHFELLFLLKPGYELFPNTFRGYFPTWEKALHGYSPEEETSYGGFASNIKPKREGCVVDLLPTALKSMKIRIPKTCDGRPLI